MTRFTEGESLSSPNSDDERIRRLEQRIDSLEQSIPQTYLQGRLRTDYTTAPTSSTDINSTNRLYDVVILINSQYIVVNDGGTLAWREITLSTF